MDRGRPRPQETSARGRARSSLAPTLPSFRRRPESSIGRRPQLLPAVDARGACCLRRHDAVGRWTPSGIGHWTAGVLARRWRAGGAPDRLRRPGKWRVVQFGAHIAVIPAKAGNHDRPQGRSFCLPWMQGALVAFVGMTLRIGERQPRLTPPRSPPATPACATGRRRWAGGHGRRCRRRPVRAVRQRRRCNRAGARPHPC